MGTFAGHALPGSFFILFAVWWTIQIFRRYYQSLQKNGTPFRASVTYPSSCLCGRLRSYEIEGCVKIFFTAVGFTLEIITAHKDGKFVHLGNAQHATMFFIFGLSGVLDLLVYHRFPLPKDIEYIAATLALTVEGVLFSFHLHGRTEMDKQLHYLLVFTVFANIAALLAEMRYRRNVLAPLTRTFFFLCQGTWFWQVGWILYPPFGGGGWDEHDHGQMMMTAMIFTWHLGINFIFMFTVGAIIGCIYRFRSEFVNYGGYTQLGIPLLKRNTNEHTVVNVNEDFDDSDLEFQKPLTKVPNSQQPG